MNSNLHKHIRCLIPILKNCYKPMSDIKRSYSIYFIRAYLTNSKLRPLPKLSLSNHQIRKVSSSNLAKSNDSNTNENSTKDESNKNALDDKEFKDLLNDFAKDFGVGSDSEQILDDIRKTIDIPSTDVDQTVKDHEKSNTTSHKIVHTFTATETKFKEFSETDSIVIPSFEEYQHDQDNEEFVYHIDHPTEFQYSPEHFKRGVHGVYDIEDLIEVLRKENVVDVTTIAVPKELHYTDFLVLATAKSPRHSKAVCEHIIKLYKMKKHIKDPFVIIEGEKNQDWKAVDMGNIVLHVFLEETRALYDLESLWLFDPIFDKGGNIQRDPLYDAIEEQMAFFSSLDASKSEDTKKKT